MKVAGRIEMVDTIDALRHLEIAFFSFWAGSSGTCANIIGVQQGVILLAITFDPNFEQSLLFEYAYEEIEAGINQILIAKQFLNRIFLFKIGCPYPGIPELSVLYGFLWQHQ